MSLHRHLRLCLAAAPFLVSACADDTPGGTGTETSVDSSSSDGADNLPNTDDNITITSLDGTGSSSDDGPTTLDGSSSSTTDTPGTGSTTDEPGTSSTTDEPGTSSTTDEPGTSSTTDEPGTSSTTDEPGTSSTTGPVVTNCCAPTGVGGCDNADCQDTVCAVDAFCCDVEWDAICANEALGACTQCGGGSGDCCAANPGEFGCEDAQCVNIICGEFGIDDTCCTTEWTAACADLAVDNCGVCAGASTGNPSTTTGDPTTGGDSDCCFANGGIGCDDQTCEDAICAADSFCCATAWDGICADAAIASCAVCDGGGGGSTTGPPPASDCCVANGGLGCDDQTCEDAICAADSFCCATSWDGICADAALATCAVCN